MPNTKNYTHRYHPNTQPRYTSYSYNKHTNDTVSLSQSPYSPATGFGVVAAYTIHIGLQLVAADRGSSALDLYCIWNFNYQ